MAYVGEIVVLFLILATEVAKRNIVVYFLLAIFLLLASSIQDVTPDIYNGTKLDGGLTEKRFQPNWRKIK